ncbi:hypothetical protein REPUB_Repub14bG0151500 [Reevesia pubescens]
MRLLTIVFTFSETIAIFAATSLADFDEEPHIPSHELVPEPTSLRGLSRFLAQQNLKANVTCDKFPRICRLKNSPGADCCKKKCVNVKTDRLNCGLCGYKCKYTEICCKGQCVDASFEKRNCGGCNKKCNKGEFCVYGMCNYA